MSATTSTTSTTPILDEVEHVAGRWWIYLVSGVAWIVFAFMLLSFDLTTVWGVAVFAAAGLLAGGAVELVAASMVSSWRWVHVAVGVVSIAAGIMALVWPGTTFLVLAAIVGWYLMANGVLDIMVAFLAREVDDLWLFTLLIGVAQVLIGFWAVGYAERSIVLLVVWVAAAALGRGMSSLFLAFGLHRAGRSLTDLRAAAG
jgi:uncharacterized membrane protein HdeD (DUF308 family)